MTPHETQPSETDPRFPSGRWTGFFLQPGRPGRHWMELLLTFHQSTVTGEGRDWVGQFLIRGQYSLQDGRCHWTKRYLGKHDVYYEGFNEGKGIWGKWEISSEPGYGHLHGGFHIWPEGMADPTEQHLTEAAPVPLPEPVEVASPEPALVPA